MTSALTIDPMYLDYARPQLPHRQTSLAIVLALAFVIFAILSVWCIYHTIQIGYALKHSPSPFTCIQAEQEWLANLGLPLEQTIPIGLLTSGFAVAALVQLIRYRNALHPRTHSLGNWQ